MPRPPLILLPLTLILTGATWPAFAFAAPLVPVTAPADASSAATISDPALALRKLFDDDAEAESGLDPLAQILRGELPEADMLRLIFTDELDRDHLAAVQDSLARLKAIPRGALDPEQQLAYDAFAAINRHSPSGLPLDFKIA